MARVVVRPAARRDLTRHLAYLVENAGLEVARRFRDSARTTFDGLAKMPEMGSPRNIGRFTDLRSGARQCTAPVTRSGANRSSGVYATRDTANLRLPRCGFSTPAWL